MTHDFKEVSSYPAPILE